MASKQEYLDACKSILGDNLAALNQKIVLLQQSLENETKSSAGDKFETARATLQSEIDRHLTQLHNTKENIQHLNNIKPIELHSVSQGALVYTKDHLFFIAVAIGKINIEERTCFCISNKAPIYKLLHGKTTGDSFIFNGKANEIIAVR